MTAATPLGPLTHRVEGDAGPPVVLLNGGMMTFPAWEPVVARLRPGHRVLLSDFRGQLLSPGEGPADLAGHAADVAALLDHLGWESSHLIGVSFGAEVAVELAAAAPDRVRSLVVVTAMDRETPEFRQGNELMRAVLADVLAGGERGRFYDVLVEGIYSQRYRAAEAATLAVRRAQVDQLPLAWFAGVDRLLAAIEGFDLTPRLAAIRCPALAVLAADDRVMDPERSRALATALGAEVALHPTSGHALVVEDPAWLAEVCLDFLGRQDDPEIEGKGALEGSL
jgi:pimeloyl-ACP methyl ester carboxylesterase